MPGVVGRVKRPPRFDARGGRKGKTDPQIWCQGYWIASLRSQWRGAGYWIASLRSQWREERGLDCFTSFAMTGGECLDCFTSFAMTGSGVLDCHASLAMTGRRETGLPRFARNDRERGCWIASLRSQWWGEEDSVPEKRGRMKERFRFFCSFRYFIF